MLPFSFIMSFLSVSWSTQKTSEVKKKSSLAVCLYFLTSCYFSSFQELAVSSVLAELNKEMGHNLQTKQHFQ